MPNSAMLGIRLNFGTHFGGCIIQMYVLILCFLTAFILTFLAIPSIINVAKVKQLVSEPNERTSHQKSLPTLGGIAIFAGVIFAIILWTPFSYFEDLQYILCAFVIIFLIGAKDDILPMSPLRKLLGELFAAVILVLKADVKISSFYGIFGIYELAPWLTFLLSVFTILVIINAFNLIDGINGLGASVGILIAAVLGYWFFRIDRIEIALIAAALIGALIAFLKYNVTPAKIFMGDTGSLLIGMICAILAMHFVELHKTMQDSPHAFKAAPATAIGILILPLFDTLRVFFVRIIKGKSPFHADRTHIHHLLVDLGMSHMQSTAILISVNILFIIMVVQLQHLGNLSLLLCMLITAILLTSILQMSIRNKKQNVLSHE